MTALKQAIQDAGGPDKAAEVCGISVRAIYKWLARDSLPRTEYTGETKYAEQLAAASGGAFTADWLLAEASPARQPPDDQHCAASDE